MNQTLINAQLALEDEILARGAKKFHAAIKKAEEAGRSADTGYAKSMLPELIEDVSTGLRAALVANGPGKRHNIRQHLAELEPEQVAYMALRAVINAAGSGNPTQVRVQAVTLSIGRLIEDEIYCQRFSEEHGKYLKRTLQALRQRGSQSYRHRHRVVMHRGSNLGVGWRSWTNDERARVGLFVLDVVLKCTSLVVIRKNNRVVPGKGIQGKNEVVFTELALQWVHEWVDYRSRMLPEFLPMLVAPQVWTGMHHGGYLSPDIQVRFPLVKVRDGSQKAALERADLTHAMEAVSCIQDVPWQVNMDVLDTMQMCRDAGSLGLPPVDPVELPVSPLPPDMKSSQVPEELKPAFIEWKKEVRHLRNLEGRRQSQAIQFSTVFKTAREFSQYDRIWFPCQMDFRGRVYAATVMSPQGPDFCRGLLRFADGEVLGPDGMFWLGVHGANKFGYDKVGYLERFKWAEDFTETATAISKDPLSHRQWLDADKPWQFLAWCFEWADCAKVPDKEAFVSHLPISMDGSCNGLQHFAAMVRDPVGGRAVNLVPQDTPADAYSAVLEVVVSKFTNLKQRYHAGEATSKLAQDFKLASRFRDNRDELGQMVEFWSGVKLSRKLTKKPVMTLPYGSTRATCTEAILDYLGDTLEEGTVKHDTARIAAVFMMPLVWASIEETMVSATVVMEWVQRLARHVGDAGKPMRWTTPLGFPVMQKPVKIPTKTVNTTLCGGMVLKYPQLSEDIDKRKQISGAVPNFVHSMDATHMQLTALAARQQGVQSMAFIHDDFAVHAGRMEVFARILRETFVALYSDTDALRNLKNELQPLVEVELPDPPTMGNLDINLVLQSKFFFS